ncbi:MAG: hypothetical protein Fur0028_09810 [Bacteroidales bacterium]
MNDLSINKVEKYFFTFISYICHPVLIPTYLLIIVFNLFSKIIIFNSSYLIAVITAYFILTAIIPIIILSLFYYFKFIHSFYLKTKEERLLVSFSMTLFYFFTYYFMRNIFIHPQLFISIMILPLSSFIFSVLLFFYPQISMHTYAIGSILGVLLFYRYFLMLIPHIYIFTSLILVSGLIITSRIALKAHLFQDTLIGYLLGMTSSFSLVLLIDLI